MSRTFKFDLLLTLSLGFLYYLLTAAFTLIPGLWNQTLALVNPNNLNLDFFLVFLILALLLAPCIIMAFKRNNVEGVRFMFFWFVSLAIFFFSDKIFHQPGLQGPPLISLPFIALCLILGWIFYARGYTKDAASESGR